MSQSLQNLLSNLVTVQVHGEVAVSVQRIDFDSRRVGEGSVFVAVKGSKVDGHDFIPQVLEKRPVAIVAERAPNAEEAALTTWVTVKDSALALGQLASAFYGQPSSRLKLVAITGTNGKTTTATVLYQAFMALGYKTGLLSTVENRIGGAVVAATHTTPDAVQLNQLLAQMVDAGCEYAFMEASSHAIDQRRTAGLQLAGAVFTNITHDHLDYHITFKAYIDAKKKLFDELPATAFALVNVDDKRGEVMLQNTKAQAHTFALRNMANFRAKLLENTTQGLHLEIDGMPVFARMLGSFNAYNLLAAYGVGILLGQNKEDLLRVLSNVPGAAGRVSYLRNEATGLTGVVDYAHTPDSVEKICETLRELLPKGKQLITVLGCGGDRDRSKRPVMAETAARLSEQCILTSDNPRTESPETILDDMQAGITPQLAPRVLRITDRRSAILTAVKLARQGDIVLVAGKGHEDYQEINGIKHPFSDHAVLAEALQISHTQMNTAL